MLRPHLVGLVFAALALGPTQAAGQLEARYRTERPDAQAPAGVRAGHWLNAGSFELRYHLETERLSGLVGDGTALTPDEVFGDFPYAPATVDGFSHRITARYAPSERFTIHTSVPFVLRDLGQRVNDGTAFVNSASGIGDVEIGALIQAYAEDLYRAHLHLDVSLPTGAIDQTGPNPRTAPDVVTLPYLLQTGSGSVEFMPGATLLSQNDFGSFGAQVRARLRLTDNDRGYRWGDRVMGTFWIAPRVGEFLSLSARLSVENWDAIAGSDPGISMGDSPAGVASWSGGTRVDIPFGANLHLVEGPLQGHRLGVEVSFPVHQDYDGIQLERRWTLTFNWTKAF